MKLLVFYPYVPFPIDRGAYQRTFHLLRELARFHEVDLLALAEGGEGVESKPVFTEFCRRVEIVPFQHPPWSKLFPGRLLNPLPATIAHWTLPQISQALGAMLAHESYDAVHVCDIVLAQYFLKENRQWPLVVDRTRVDLFYQLMERRQMKFPWRTRILNYENCLKLWSFERAVARRAALEIVCGIDDANFLQRYVRRDTKVATIPNGVDLDYFFPDAVPTERRAVQPTILFCGAMDYNPNIDALRWYFDEIHHRLQRRVPDLQVLIVGKNPAEEVRRYAGKPDVVVTGGVPDVRPYYRRAWLQIVPLRIGGGTRLKIVESMAMGTPVVSTTIGAQGLGLRQEFDILLADDPESFASQTAAALHSLELRDRLQRNGLETAQRRLSWQTLGAQLSGLYSGKTPGLTGRSVPVPTAVRLPIIS
jgi:glycosyltransferase involved in cell wall biosynthesis